MNDTIEKIADEMYHLHTQSLGKTSINKLLDDWATRLRAIAAAPSRGVVVDEAMAEADDFAAMLTAYKTWPDDVRKKLSAHDLRRMGGWRPMRHAVDAAALPAVPDGFVLYGWMREQDGRLQISDAKDRPDDRSSGIATPWFSVYVKNPQSHDQTQRVDVERWGYCPECGCAEVHHEEGSHKQCENCGQEWFSDINYTNVVCAHLAGLQSAKSKLAEQAAEIERLRGKLAECGIP